MKKILLLIALGGISLILFNSCDLFLTAPTASPEYEEWGCLINANGSGFEYVSNTFTSAIFTPDSEKLLYKESDGFYTYDFTSNVEKVSDVTGNVILSHNQQYFIKIMDNDIFRMDFDGSNLINLTNSPETQKMYPSFDIQDEKITYSSYADSLYTISIMDIDGNNQIDVIAGSPDRLSYPVYNYFDEKIYYRFKNSISTYTQLKSIFLNGTDNNTIADSVSSTINVSFNGEKVLYIKNMYTLILYNVDTNISTSIVNHYPPNENYRLPKFFSNNETILFDTGSTLWMINTDGSELQEFTEGYSPVISPNDEKIFFVRERRLPIDEGRRK